MIHLRHSTGRPPRPFLAAAGPAALGLALLAPGVEAQAQAQAIGFNRDIRPILSDNCFHCHGPDAHERKARLRLDLRESATAERKGRVAIRPFEPGKSELVRRIHAAGTKDLMPPTRSHKQLAKAEIDLLTRWVAEGAVYQAHWSYEPPRDHPLPPVRDAGWCRDGIDRWVLAGLESQGLQPAPEADRITLLRRLTFDLTGLPPSLAEIDDFVADRRDDAYERAVDRLLASPHYGERMAMYWLDLVRFADTVGYHGDQSHPIAPYRDWVIDAFNANMGFDRFTTEQLAGDLLPRPTRSQIIATGYNRLLQTTHEGGAQAKEYLAIYAADRVRNFGSVWLGGTVGCAQCHDHKYDPYTQRDFYSLAAFFADIEEQGDFKSSPNTDPTTRPPELLILEPADQVRLDEVDARLAELTGRQHEQERRELQRRRKAIAARGRRTMITRPVPPRPTRVLARGNWLDESGEIVAPRVPHFLPQIEVAGGARATRLDLARWLTRPDHPLTARVFANRMWYLFFGKGISSHLMDLGAQGESPRHPELLDLLARRFVRGGWDIKRLVRAIVTSSTYRQSTVTDAGLIARDPHNRLLARQTRWRLPAEMIRDNALAIGGLLAPTVGGDSVKPYQPAGYYQHLNFPRRVYHHHTDQRQWRRGVYVHWQRQFLHPALKAFDAPTREECTAERPVSNTPQAALTLLNDPTFVEAARGLAGRLLRAPGGGEGDALGPDHGPGGSGAVDGDDARLSYGFRLATSRRPAAAELATLRRILDRHRDQYRKDPAAARALVAIGLDRSTADLDPVDLAAWISVARVLLNLAETITRN